MRIVSHTCSNTEIVCALGCAADLVGVDDHSDYPPEIVAGLPRIGPDLGVDVGKVKALRPDLVITSLTVPGHEKVVAELRQSGLPLLICQPQSLADIAADMRRIAAALNVAQRGEQLAADFLSALSVAAPQAADPPRVLVEWWPKPVIVPGARSWVTELIRLAGGVNPLAERDVESSPISDDEARAMAPDAVVISWCGVPFENYRAQVVQRRSGWQNMPALRNKRIYCISEAWLGRPGPRLVEGLQALRRIVADCR